MESNLRHIRWTYVARLGRVTMAEQMPLQALSYPVSRNEYIKGYILGVACLESSCYLVWKKVAHLQSELPAQTH